MVLITMGIYVGVCVLRLTDCICRLFMAFLFCLCVWFCLDFVLLGVALLCVLRTGCFDGIVC